jgi:hypothetical protein
LVLRSKWKRPAVAGRILCCVYCTAGVKLGVRCCIYSQAFGVSHFFVAILISNLQIGNISDKISRIMLGQDIALLLKLSLAKEEGMLSTRLAAELFIVPSEVSKALQRCKRAGLLSGIGREKRVNRAGLVEFIVHGLRYAFPPETGSMTRGVPTGASAEPLKSCLTDDGEPPQVWPYAEGKIRGLAFSPLYKGAPRAALLDNRFYELLALCDAIRGGRVRERTLGTEKITEAVLHGL